MNETVSFGILGCGSISSVHAGALQSLPEARLAGVADAVEERARSTAEKYGIRGYRDYSEMLSDPAIDAVCICTPSGCHAEDALKALRAGKHVVVEKPMALSVEDADRIQQEVQKSGKLLTVISQLRFAEDIQRLRKLVEEGAFGKLIFCDLSMKYWRDEEYYSANSWRGTKAMDGGGALMNQGIHGVDILLYLAGPATVLEGRALTRHHSIEVEDTAAALLQFENGALGCLQASTCTHPGHDRRLELTGERGYALLRENLLELLILDGETVLDRTKEEKNFASASDPTAVPTALHALQLQNLIDAIHGKAELLIPASEGRRAVELITSLYARSENT